MSGRVFASGGIGEIAWLPAGIVVDSDFAFYLVSPNGRVTSIGPAEDIGFSASAARVASGSLGCGSCSGPVSVVSLTSHRVIRVGLPRRANAEPALSPDGRRVAWVSNGAIWVAALAGGGARRIVTDGSCPEWSPDGQWIAYIAGDSSLRVVAAAGGSSVTLAPFTGCGQSWSPDSTRIAFDANRLMIVDVRTRRLVTAAATLGRILGLAWSADGSSLYVSARPKADEAQGVNCAALWLLNASTLRGTRLVSGCT